MGDSSGEAREAGRPSVVYFQRKRWRSASFSIEAVFEDVRRRLEGKIDARVSVAMVPSKGVLRRLFVMAEAWWRRGAINHVTGDINFVGLALPGRRTIQTIHDVRHLHRTWGLRRWVLRKAWVTWPVRRAAVVTVVSEATRQELLPHVRESDWSKIVVIPVAVADRYRFVQRPFNRVRPTILQVGTAENKNVMRLAQALGGISCVLEIVGAPEANLRAALEENGVAYRWRSDLSEDDIVQAYIDADLVSFISSYEGFGMPIVEAQATGRPVVTSDVLSMPEVAGGGACLVDPFDVEEIRRGILRVIDDDRYREELVRKGLENVGRFRSESVAGRYLRLYRAMATANGD